MSAPERQLLVEGRRVAYLERGPERTRETLPAFLLLHGLGGSARHWLEVIPALGERSRVVALDLPGFGRSESMAGGVTLDRIADVAAAAVRILGLGPVLAVGHSFSGPVAIRFAARHPELAAGAALLSGAVFQFSDILGLRRLGSHLRHGPRSALAICAEALGVGLPLPPIARRAVARSSALRRALLWPYVSDPSALSARQVGLLLDGVGAPGVLPVVRAVGGSDPLAGIERVECPLLSVAGARDLIVPIADTEELARRVPRAQTVVFEGSGHMVMLERPADLARRLIDFWSTCSSRERNDREALSHQ